MGDLDLNVEKIYYALSFLNASKEKITELSLVLHNINVNGVELKNSGLLTDAKSIVNSILNGTLTDIGNRLEKTKNVIIDADIDAEIYFAFLDGEFNDEFGNYDEEKVYEYIEKKEKELYDEAVKQAEEEYYEKLRTDPDYRYEVALKTVLSENGYESLEQIDTQREKILNYVRDLQAQKNAILFSDAQVTLKFLDVVNNKYMGICSSFGGIANNETLVYKYVDKYGIENFSWTFDGIPKDYQNNVESLSYTDMCEGSDLYNQVKSGFDGNWFFTSPFNSDYRQLNNKIQEQLVSENSKLDEINKSLNTNREKLAGLDATKQSIIETATYASEDVWKYTLNEDFDENSSNVKSDEISSILNNIKNTRIAVSFNSDSLPGFNQNYLYLNNREEEMQVIYSLIAGTGQFYAGYGEVFYVDNQGKTVYLKHNDDMLSNMSLWATEMSDDQKAIFYYNWNTGGYEAAYEYLENISDELNDTYVYNKTKEDQEYADKNPGWASTASVLFAPFEGLKSFEYSVIQLLNKDKMYSSQLYSHGDTMRARVSTNIATNPDDKYAETKAFMYNVGMSIADNLYSMAITGGNPTGSGMILAAGGFDNNMNDALSRGLSDSEAFLYSGSMAAIEAATEAISIDNLVNLKNLKYVDNILNVSEDAMSSSVRTANRVLKQLDSINNFTDDVFGKTMMHLDNITDPKYRNIVYKGANVLYGATKQGTGEGMEELASSILGNWADGLISGDNSAYNLSVENYINNGYTEAEAIALTNQQQVEEMVTSYLSGLTSGSITGGGKLAGSLAMNDVSSYVGNMIDKYKNPNYDVVNATIAENLRTRNFEGAIDFIMNQDGKSIEEKSIYAGSVIAVLSNTETINGDMQQRLNNIVQSYVNADSSVDNETKVESDDSYTIDSVHGFQLDYSSFGSFYKSKIDSGFFTSQQVQLMLNNINNKGFISESTGKYFSEMFESEDYDVYVKTIHSTDLSSIMHEGIRCLGTSTSGYGMAPTSIFDVNLDNTVTKVDDVYDLFTTLKNANGVSQGMNPIDGTLVVKIPKGLSINDILYFSDSSGTYCIKPEYIDCFSSVDSNGIVGEPIFNEVNTDVVVDQVIENQDEFVSEETMEEITVPLEAESTTPIVTYESSEDLFAIEEPTVKQESLFESSMTDPFAMDEEATLDLFDGLFMSEEEATVKQVDSFVGNANPSHVGDITTPKTQSQEEITVPLETESTAPIVTYESSEDLFAIEEPTVKQESVFESSMTDPFVMDEEATLDPFDGLFMSEEEATVKQVDSFVGNANSSHVGDITTPKTQAQEKIEFNQKVDAEIFALDILDSNYAKKLADIKYKAQLEAKVLDAIHSKGMTLEYYLAKCGEIPKFDPATTAIIQQQAKVIADKAFSIEPSVTSLMKSLQDGNAHLVSLDKKFKSQFGIESKISRLMSSHGCSAESAATLVNDSLRYTLICDAGSYSDTVIAKLAKLKTEGYQIESMNNAWNNSAYKGLNVTLVGQDGVYIELQFHTQSSFDVKQKRNHLWYEISRSPNVDADVKSLAYQIQIKNQQIYNTDKVTFKYGSYDIVTLNQDLDNYIAQMQKLSTIPQKKIAVIDVAEEHVFTKQISQYPEGYKKYEGSKLPADAVIDSLDLLSQYGSSYEEALANIGKKYGKNSIQYVTATGVVAQTYIYNNPAINYGGIDSTTGVKGTSDRILEFYNFIGIKVKDVTQNVVAANGGELSISQHTAEEVCQNVFADDYKSWNSVGEIINDGMKSVTGNWFTTINNALRSGVTSSISSQLGAEIVALHQYLDSLPGMTDTTLLYRGLNNLDWVANGSLKGLHGQDLVDAINSWGGGIVEVGDNGFSSSTPVLGQGFTRYCPIVEVTACPPGTKGAYIGNNSTYPTETEWLLNAGGGNKKVILGSELIDGKVYVYTQMILE